MLTPTVVQDERLWEEGRDSLEILDSVRVGTRSGLLPFSRDRMTSNYNRDSLEAYRNGELDLALFYANNSLRLDSMQPEMRRLRSSFSSEMSDEFREKMLHEKILEREMEYMPPDTCLIQQQLPISNPAMLTRRCFRSIRLPLRKHRPLVRHRTSRSPNR